MSSHELSLPLADPSLEAKKTADDTEATSQGPNSLPPGRSRLLKGLSPFWHDRLIEFALILAMALYYIVGNARLGTGSLFDLNPLFSLPFLFIFAVLCWYRLSFAVALLPLTLPYYLLPKTVVSHYSFSLAEIVLGTCLLVALLQFLLQRGSWQYLLSWRELRDRFGPFAIPILIFFLAAAGSVVIAYSHFVALRAFRKEVLDPLLYLLLALFCLRSRHDVGRLLGALLGTGVMVAVLGLSQYFFFKNQLVLEPDGIRRVHATYGSANSIGLLLDYILPPGLALVVMKMREVLSNRQTWKSLLFAVGLCLPLVFVLYLTQSRGAWFAIGIATLFIIALSIRSRKVLLIGGLVLVIGVAALVLIFHTRIAEFIIGGHVNAEGVSTVTRRLYLWQSALNMISGSPWLGYGLDNWLCHYSLNSICYTPSSTGIYHYWILNDPVTGAPTGLRDEPALSHPHNIFLHVWVSIGIFGLIAFVSLPGLFFWLFARILSHLRSVKVDGGSYLEWMTLAVGAAMLAALVQGMVDSAFLEQDLAFCFWMLVAALLVVRVLSGVPWRGRLRQETDTRMGVQGGESLLAGASGMSSENLPPLSDSKTELEEE